MSRRYISLDSHWFVDSRCAFAAQGSPGPDKVVNSSSIVFENVDLNTCNGYNASTGKVIRGIFPKWAESSVNLVNSKNQINH